MNELLTTLQKKADSLEGRVASDDEILLLSKSFGNLPWIGDLEIILKTFRIIGMRFSLSEKRDSSAIEMRMRWMTPQDQVDEAFQFFPGIVICKHGFLPIGSCLRGSGDPYFLKVDNKNWEIYRALHDMCADPYNENMTEYITTIEAIF